MIQKEIEDELSFEELKVLRSIAVAIVRKEEALRRVGALSFVLVFAPKKHAYDRQ